MNKVIETLCLNGPNLGQVHRVELDYTQEQEDEAKKELEFKVDEVLYAGWCRACGRPVTKGQENYLKNVDGLGKLYIDVFHKYCNKY